MMGFMNAVAQSESCACNGHVVATREANGRRCATKEKQEDKGRNGLYASCLSTRYAQDTCDVPYDVCSHSLSHEARKCSYAAVIDKRCPTWSPRATLPFEHSTVQCCILKCDRTYPTQFRTGSQQLFTPAEGAGCLSPLARAWCPGPQGTLRTPRPPGWHSFRDGRG